jgi:hypothetical protein
MPDNAISTWKWSLWTTRRHETHAATHMRLIKHALVGWRECCTAAEPPLPWHVYNPEIWIHHPDLASACWDLQACRTREHWEWLRCYSTYTTWPLGISVRDPLFQGT